MDSNFINIDDLVRQRLNGAEEQERAGAWLRMRELLDKEERKWPVGIYWRRTFGAIGLLLLLSAMSLGGYKLSSFKKLGGSDAAIASAAAKNTAGTPGVANNTAVSPAPASNDPAQSEKPAKTTDNKTVA